jgi:hypothetical protein
MNLQQRESRMFGHEVTVRSFDAISHRFLAKPGLIEANKAAIALYLEVFVAIC